MQKKQETYNGFWKKAGCFLSLIAILTIIGSIGYALYVFFLRQILY